MPIGSRFNSKCPSSKNWAYFDNAAVAPMPTVAIEAVEKWLGEASHEGDTIWLEWAQHISATRKTGRSDDQRRS